MSKLIVLPAFSMLVACNFLPTAIKERISPDPGSGMYSSPTGEFFKVSTTGPTPFRINATNGTFCLIFWEIKNGAPQDTVKLQGQECNNRTFGDLKWSASFPKGKRGIISIKSIGDNTTKHYAPLEIRKTN